MDEYKLNKQILCIDLKSFYASVECSLRNLDPFTTPLVVADRSRGKGALCLAVSPYLKKIGVPSRCRVYDLPQLPHGEIIYARPRMKTYMEFSIKIIEIYLRYISEDDLYVYSIDEAFLDVTPYLKLYQKTAYELAKEITDAIRNELKIYSSCGIGPNMLMAKLAMDIDAKKTKEGIAEWTYEDVPTKLWPVEPLSEMWGIGHRMQAHLNQLGLYKVGDIANFSRKRLKNLFGVLGEELWFHTHGIDMSILQDKYQLRSSNKSVGQSQILFHDYYTPEIYIIIQEMVDEVLRRLRLSKKLGRTISLSIGYNKDRAGGFSKQFTLDQPTQSFSIVHDVVLTLFNSLYDGSPIRSIGISIGNLTQSTIYQYSLFEDSESLAKEQALLETVDDIKSRFGKNLIHRATALEEGSTIIARSKMVGGHNG
ncbi:MAG TPA: damage repair protein [Acholeplasma sp.]